MEVDAVAVRGEPRRHLALQRLDGVVGAGRRPARGTPRKPATSARPLRSSAAMVLAKLAASVLAGNRLDFRHVLGHGALECGPEMFRADRREGRRLAGTGPDAEQRIGRVCCGAIGG